MSKLTGFWTRLRRALNRRAFEQQMASEMREHLERESARRIATGEDPETARRHAAIEFGHVDSIKEEVRDRRFGAWLDETARNVRFAWRGLRKSPGFTVVAIATIAIGIGAGTAVYSLVNAIVLRSLAVPDPQALRVLHWTGDDIRYPSMQRDYSRDFAARPTIESFNHPTYLRLREQATGIAEVFAHYPLYQITARAQGTGLSVEAAMVSDNFFSGLGVQAWRGRLFTVGDDAAAVPQVVISHDTWVAHFASDPDVLRRTIAMHGVEHAIIGVLPRTFRGIRPGNAPGLYVSMSAGSPFLFTALTNDWHWFVRLMARLHPGRSETQLTSALTTAFAEQAADRMANPRVAVLSGYRGLDFDRDAYGRPLLIMLGVTILVMLVACANLAGLSLARGAARRHELALRVALGAGRGRLIRQSLTESAVLAVLGGGLGVLLAMWGSRSISRLLAGSADGLQYDISLKLDVLGFSLAATAATALLTGLFPALRAGQAEPLEGLKARGTSGSPKLGMGRVLVVAQICISLALLTGAGLGLRSFMNVQQIDPGFDPENLLVFEVNAASAGYEGPARIPFYDRVHEALIEIPGSTGAALMQFPLLAEKKAQPGFQFTTRPARPDVGYSTHLQSVNESFFDTMGIPIQHGRTFTTADDGAAARVAVVNEAFVQRYLDGDDPLGHVVSIWDADWRIVGVCRDARFDHLKAEVPPTTYLSFRQRFYGRLEGIAVPSANFAVRSTLAPGALRTAAERALASVDPGVPATNVTTQLAQLNRNISQDRMLATLCAALAGVALLLCCIGLYGLIAYEVTRRRSEIAIRMAIGAQRSAIAWPILRDATRLAALGIGAGLPGVVATMQLIKSQLYGVSPLDPATIGSVVVVLFTVAALAAWVPARRATRVDPLTALRNV